MTRQYPLWNQYWDDKRAKFAEIDVPIYASASFSTMLHTEGTIRGFLFSSSKDKWFVGFKLHVSQTNVSDLKKQAPDPSHSGVV